MRIGASLAFLTGHRPISGKVSIVSVFPRKIVFVGITMLKTGGGSIIIWRAGEKVIQLSVSQVASGARG